MIDVVTWADNNHVSRTAALRNLDAWIMNLERILPKLGADSRMTALGLIEFLWVCRADLIVAGERDAP